MEVLIADTFTEIRESDKQSESIEIVESIVTERYRYLVGSNTGLPFVRSETLLHYNLNPSDYNANQLALVHVLSKIHLPD